MKKLIVRRLIISVVLILGITFFSFLIVYLAPGDPTTLFSLNPNISQEDIIQLRKSYGLDKPIYVQYFLWLKKLIRGDMGRSLIYRERVAKVIVERIPATVLLMGSSLIISVIISIILGLLSAWHRGSLLDKICNIYSYFAISMPSFWLAIVLIYLFYYKWNIVGNYNALDKAGLQNMVMPLTVLVIGNTGFLLRYIRNRALEVMDSDFVVAARARGISESKIMWNYVFRNASLPLITILGMSLPSLFGGAAIIERIFSWSGIGWLTFEAVFKFDYPLIMGVLFISSILVILGNLLADILYAVVDPRVRYEEKK